MMKVQVSHSFEDRTFANGLCSELRKIGIEPHQDDLKARFGDENFDRVKQELTKYDFVVSVLSQPYLKDKFLELELFSSMMIESETKTKFLIPIVIDDSTVPYHQLKDKLIDFRKKDAFHDAVSQLSEILTRARGVFVISKFGDPQLDSMYNMVIKPVAKDFGFEARRIDEVQNSGVINDQILRAIERSDIIVADLTGERPNCYYETGYAHALGKELILTVKSGADIHFDLSHRRFIVWNTEHELMNELRKRMAAIVGGG